jgi:hypothetical protein
LLDLFERVLHERQRLQRDVQLRMEERRAAATVPRGQEVEPELGLARVQECRPGLAANPVPGLRVRVLLTRKPNP